MEICRDPNFKDYLLNRYCAIGGTGGNEEGRSIARKLRAVFFTEHFNTLKHAKQAEKALQKKEEKINEKFKEIREPFPEGPIGELDMNTGKNAAFEEKGISKVPLYRGNLTEGPRVDKNKFNNHFGSE
nr:unnamed protein product [Callosobruchus analis]